tara:strand:+ start:3274 stop:3495 length:222 start_codon:yes stop_codon:yes gene_type:complete
MRLPNGVILAPLYKTTKVAAHATIKLSHHVILVVQFLPQFSLPQQPVSSSWAEVNSFMLANTSHETTAKTIAY